MYLRGVKTAFWSVFLLTLFLGTVYAEETFNIVIKNHEFSPGELKIPANQKVTIVIDNQDETEEEFESYDLDREEIVGGNSQITVYIGPLKPGTYKYFGEFNQDTAQGTIIVE